MPYSTSRSAVALALLIWTSLPIAGLGQTAAPAARPRAVVAEPDYDFGMLEQGQLVTRVFRIRNEGTAPLTISRIDLSQPSMRSRFQRVIPAQGEGTITIEWDTTRFTGDLTAEAVVLLDDPSQRRLSLTLRGMVRSPIDLLPAPEVYFSVFRDESPTQTVTIVNNEERPLTIATLQPQGDHFKADLRTVREGKTYEVAISIPKGLPAGRYREAVVAETDHPRRGRLRIGVNVFVKNDVYATPEIVDFGDIRNDVLRNPALNKLMVQSFTVRKRYGRMTITGASSDLSGVDIASDPTGPSDSFRVDVSLKPDQIQPGTLKGTIRLRTDDPEFPELAIPIQGSVH